MLLLSSRQAKFINDLSPGGLFLTPAQFELLSMEQARCLIQFLVLWKNKLVFSKPRKHYHCFRRIKKLKGTGSRTGEPVERFIFICRCGEIKQETLAISRDAFGHRFIKRERPGFNSKTNV